MPEWQRSEWLLGRDSELGRLDAALLEAHADAYGVVVCGDAGVGKSRLLSTFAHRARANGHVVLEGTCLEIGDSWPYFPLESALRRMSADAAGTTYGITATSLLELLSDSNGAGHGRVLESLHYGLVDLASGQKPLVLVIDDLQWADDSTRRVLLTLLSRLTAARMLLIGSMRTDDLQPDSTSLGLIRELQRSRSAEVLELDPLSQAVTEKLAEAVAGHPLARATADEIWVRSGGNPFVVEELVRSRTDGGFLPASLRQMVRLRVSRLSNLAQEIMRAVSSGAGPVPHDVLSRVVPYPMQDLLTAAKTAIEKGLLVASDQGYVVRHKLVQEVLTADLLPAEQADLHRRFAGVLSEMHGAEVQEQLAYHWHLAGDLERALSAAVAAAEQAAKLHAHDEAWKYWRQVVEYATSLASRPDLPELLSQAAEAAHLAGDHDAALALVDRLEVEGRGRPADPNLRETLSMMRGRYFAEAGRIAPAQLEYERILALPDVDDARRAEASARSAELLVQLGRYTAATKRAQFVVLHPEKGIADPMTQVVASAALGFSQAYLGDPGGGRKVIERAVEEAMQSQQPDAIGKAHLYLAELLIDGPSNELEEGVKVALLGVSRVTEVGSGRTHGTALLAAAANGLFRIGKWVEAAKYTSRALAQDPTGRAGVDLLLARARIVIALGDFGAAERDLRSVETLLADGGGSRQLVPLAILRAGLAIWMRRPDDARHAVSRGLQSASDDFDDIGMVAPLIWHGLRAEAEAVALGDSADQEAVRQLRTAGQRITVAAASMPTRVREVVEGYAALSTAELTRINGNSDPDAWRNAEQLWQLRAQPYPVAYAEFRRAEGLFEQRTHHREAAHSLRAAHAIIRKLSAGPLRMQIEALALRARVELDTQTDESVTPPLPPPERPEMNNPLTILTVREREVLAEVTAGHSNREIAKHLFISERTVEVHISRVLAKLHVRTRVQAATTYLRYHQQLTT